MDLAIKFWYSLKRLQVSSFRSGII